MKDKRRSKNQKLEAQLKIGGGLRPPIPLGARAARSLRSGQACSPRRLLQSCGRDARAPRVFLLHPLHFILHPSPFTLCSFLLTLRTLSPEAHRCCDSTTFRPARRLSCFSRPRRLTLKAGPWSSRARPSSP